VTAPIVTEKGGMALLAELEANGAISQIGLHLSDPNLSRDRAEAIGFLLGRMHESLRFAIGDWLLLIENLFPVEWTQMSEALGLSEEGRREFMRVAERVPRSTRRKSLSWSHHRAVAALDPPRQKEWLSKAIANDLSHHALREALRSEGTTNAARGSLTTCRCCHRPL
jgi:hypothetical protein